MPMNTNCIAAATRTPDGYITVVRTLDRPSLSTRQADADARRIGGRGTRLVDKHEAASMTLLTAPHSHLWATFDEPVSVRRYRDGN